MKWIVFLLSLPMIVCLSSCGSQPEIDTSSLPPSTYLNLGSDVSYVGIEACKTCHPAQYETYVQSEMGRSFRPATLSNSDANFIDAKPVYDSFSQMHYQPYHDGEDLYLMEYRLSGRDTVHRRIEKIDYIVGSGQHTNSHIMEESGYLYQMPLTWYAQDGKWDLPPKFSGGNNSRFGRPIPLQCMTCHNAMPEFVQGSENRYSKVPHGIDCERCHGPGSLHVEEKMAGKVVDVTTEIDYTIVNPRKLPVDLQFDICQNCHMQGVSIHKPGETPLDFRPGRPMLDVQNVFWPRYADSVNTFIMASHPDRLKMSACFRESHAAPEEFQPLTCISCHNPHVSIKTLGPAYFNEKCQSCHTPAKNNLCAEDEAVRAASNDNCVTCHMPVSGSSDIPHVRVTDHFIRTPIEGDRLLSTEEMEAQKKLVGLASLIENDPPITDVVKGFLTYYEEVTNNPVFLDSALVYLERARAEAPARELAPLWIWAWFWRQDYGSIIGLAGSLNAQTIQDPWTLYRIGEAYLSTGQPANAIRYLQLAVGRAPEHLRFLNKLAAAYTNAGNFNEALSIYDSILDVNPNFEAAYNDRGFAHILMGDFEAAEADLVTALDLDPDAISPLGNLASLYYNTGRGDEARPYVQRLLELDPDNPDYLNLWSLVTGR